MFDMIILGAGMAGLTCALYAKRAQLNVMVIEHQVYGGQIMPTPDIQNYPGCPEISGFALMETVYKQAVSDFGTPFSYETVQRVSLEQSFKEIITKSNTYQAKTVVIATGAKHRKLGCPGEEEFSGKGVSYCATCDGAFFKEKRVAVIGGGNTAVEDAAYLSNLCEHVYLIHRRDSFRADPITVTATLAAENITPIYHAVCDEILGDTGVTGMLVRHLQKDETQHLSVDGVFVAVGAQPDNGLFRDVVNMDAGGYIVAGEDCKTNIHGVFVAGDTRTKEVRQLVTAAADGAIAAQMAAMYLRLS